MDDVAMPIAAGEMERAAGASMLTIAAMVRAAVAFERGAEVGAPSSSGVRS